MEKSDLLSRLHAADPGWPEWAKLMAFVQGQKFKAVEDEFLGKHLVAGKKISFGVSKTKWPKWMPQYVPALYGMKTGSFDEAGGFAKAFDGKPAIRGSLFTGTGDDEQLRYPVIKVPPGLYPFQTTSTGALVHVSKDLQVHYPDAEVGILQTLDSLEEFVKKNITSALKKKMWESAYDGVSLGFD